MLDGFEVLIVDDDPDLAAMAAAYVERTVDHVSVTVETHPDAALERFRSEDLDCIVADYEMPERSGLDLLETVRIEDQAIPFILFTGQGSESVASQAISAGVTDYLQKRGPGTFELLAHRIDQISHEYEATRFERATKQQPFDLLERISDAVLALDSQWQVTYLNEPAAEVFGVDREELVGKNIWEEFPAAAESGFFDAYQEALETGTPRTIEEYYEPWDRWYRERIFPASDGLSVVFNDITDRKRRERELTVTKERMQLALDHTDIIVFEIDAESGAVTRHGAFSDYFETDPDAVPTWTDHLETVVHPRDQDDFRSFFEAMIAGDRTEGELTYRTRTEEGSIRWIRDTAILQRNADGEPDRVVGIAQDITDRKQKERQLEEVKERFQRYVEHSQDLIAVLDESGTVTYQSPSITQELGYTPEEFEGENVFEYLHPEDRPRILRRFEVMVTADEERTERVEGRIRNADGDWMWFEAVGSNRTRDEADGYVINARIIQERKVQEQLLDQHRENLEKLHRTATRLHATRDVEACYDLVIEASVSILGFDWCTIATPTPSDTFEIAAVSDSAPLTVGEQPFGTEEGLAGAAYQSGETRLDNEVDRSDRAKPTDDAIRSALTVPFGEFGIYQAVSTDSGAFGEHDRRHAELLIRSLQTAIERIHDQQRLERQNERLDEFAAIVSHDLRSPLTVAKGRLDLAREETDSNQLTEVADALERMERLIEDLLRLAREDEQVTEMDSNSLERLLEDCWTEIEGANASLEIVDDRTILGDPGQLRQLIENLLRNAVEHGGEGVTVTVGTRPGGFFIEDDGPGIPSERRDQVFRPGYSTAPDGTGFGLRIVERIAAGHGWTVELEESPEGGARFVFTGVKPTKQATTELPED